MLLHLFRKQACKFLNKAWSTSIYAPRCQGSWCILQIGDMFDCNLLWLEAHVFSQRPALQPSDVLNEKIIILLIITVLIDSVLKQPCVHLNNEYK